MKHLILLRALLLTLLVSMLPSGKAIAQEAYVHFDGNETLTFYYDNNRSQRSGNTYDMNSGYDNPKWRNGNVTHVVFDASFRNARPTTTAYWFESMGNLTTITGMKENLNTSEVTTMRSMFYQCFSLTSADVSNFDTHNVKDMSSMFFQCYLLLSLDVSGFDTQNVTNMYGMFLGCKKLTFLDLSNFDTSNVTNISYMFQDCFQLETIYASDKWTTANAGTGYGVFDNCYSLVGGAGTTFDGHTLSTYAHIDGGPDDPGYLTMKYPSYTVYNNGTLTFYFDDKRSQRTGMTYDLNSGSNSPGWITDGTYDNVTSVVFDASFRNARPMTTNLWFYHMTSLTSIKGMKDNLNTCEVTNMAQMFHNATKLTTIDLSGFNTRKVETMYNMFAGCSDLKSADLSSFNTANMTNMGGLFNGCGSLTSVDLHTFSTGNVTNMWAMFYNCMNLTEIDLGSFDTRNVQRTNSMFEQCSELTAIYVGDKWNTETVRNSTSMFTGCVKLVGAKGTTYDERHVDASYAHIDGGQANPGYLTMKLPYAVYNNGTLTFYYDINRSQRSGKTYDLNSGTNHPEWYDDGNYNSVTRVVFDPLFVDARPTSTYMWFAQMAQLTTITGLSRLNTTAVTTMQSMFFNCSSLKSIDLSNFDTSNVTYMYGFFNGCKALTFLDLSTFDTKNVTNMRQMFSQCSALKAIFVGRGWNTDAVENSNLMFYQCYNLAGDQRTTFTDDHTNADYGHIDGGASNPGYLSKKPYAVLDGTRLIFYNDGLPNTHRGTAYALSVTISTPQWYKEKATNRVYTVEFDPSFANAHLPNAYAWFYGMEHLYKIEDIQYLKTDNMTAMDYMFSGCSNLSDIDLNHFNTENTESMYAMFYNCSTLTSLDLSSFDTQKVLNMEHLFRNCTALTTILVDKGWNTENVTASQAMFTNCTNLVGGAGTTFDATHTDKAYAHVDGGTNNPGYLTLKVPYAVYDNGTLTFYHDGLQNAKQGTVYTLGSGYSTPGWVTDLNNKNITKVVFDNTFADARPTSTYKWFSNCTNLKTIKDMKKNLNTSDVEIMEQMFAWCGLESLDLSGFNTQKVQNMYYMFNGSKTLKSIDMSNFDTRNVANMSNMFNGCSGLTSLDLSSFDTQNVANMSYMFNSCTGLTSLNLSSFDTQNVTNMTFMFSNSSALTTIIVSDSWNTDQVERSNGMFRQCTSLVGGAGTTYDADHVDVAYAHIDGGTANPGYFTSNSVKGDVNCDGQVGIGDIVAITNVMAGIETNPDIISRANVNGDTEVGIGDIVTITNIMAGIE
ncbi:MAG: BspA family leucine-rich repeat surface protein [Prevotella sp.]|nr:BspA family leucine-rich repeat surface protein [Prevotella sp.]